MSLEATSDFRWGLHTLASLAIGVSATVLFIAIGATGHAQKVFEILLAPGFSLATLVYGGLHGGEPILLGVFVNTLVYSVVSLIVMWIRFRRASASARP